MSNLPTYQPISCDFHSELELLSMQRTACHIIFKNQIGKPQQVHSIIKDIYTRKGEEFLILQTDETIRLDQLISVNGMELSNYC